MRKKKGLILTTMILVSLITIMSICIGSYPLSISDIFKILTEGVKDTIKARVFWNLRLPRVLMGLAAGAALGLSGAVYQTIFRNSLASPDLTGVASGASFGAACMIVLGSGNAFAVMSGSFVMGMLSLLFVFVLTRLSNLEKVGSYILAGVIVSSLADAGLMILKYAANPERELAAIEFWTMGSLAAITKEKLMPTLIFVVLPVLLILLFYREIVMLSLGNEHARSLGLSPELWRVVFLTLSTFMVSSIVSVTGVIAFVGLIAPHITFMIYKRKNGTYFFLCALWGGILLLMADIFARTLCKGSELPLSILTVLLSVPMLIWLLCRKRGKQYGTDL